MKIIGDNSAIGKNLGLLKTLIEDLGGALDPDLVIRCEDGGLSVEKHGPSRAGQPLIALPEELLLPTEQMGLYVSDNEIGIKPVKGTLTDAQRHAAEAMLEIYNLTGKIALHKESCCWFSFRQAPEILEKLLAGRTLNKPQQQFLAFTKGRVAPDFKEEEFVCQSYIKTRTIGLGRNADSESEEQEIADDKSAEIKAESEPAERVTDIMPIVDFINHHPEGSPFSFREGYDKQDATRKFLMVDDHRPLLDSNQCFAYYNQMDAIDSFLTYGFPDTYATMVRSIPIEFEVPGNGRIIIKSMMSAMRKGKLPKQVAGLRPYIPHSLKNTSEEMVLTYILIPAIKYSENALRRVLRLAITNKVAITRNLNATQIWECVLQAEEKILRTNIAFYQNLLADLEKSDRKESPQHRMICHIANLQLVKLYKYRFAETGKTLEDQEQAEAAE